MPSHTTLAGFRIGAAISLLYLTYDLYTNMDYSAYGYGVKAALLAFGAAISMFYELLPSGSVRKFYLSLTATWSTRITGALLATLAAWNWLLAETDGDPLPLIKPLLIAVAVALFIPIMMLANGLAIDSENRKRSRK